MRRSVIIALLLTCVLAYPVQAQTATPLPVNMRGNISACYALEESGGSRLDSAGTLDLADNATVLRGVGRVSKGAKFTYANSEYLSIADNADYSSTASFTFAVWYNPATVGTAQGLFSKYAAANDGEYACHVTAAAAIDCIVTNNTTAQTINSGVTVTPGTWYLVVFSYDLANQRLTLNVNNSADVTLDLGYALPDTGNAFWVGRYVANYSDMVLDELMYWKGRVLTYSEKTWLYNGGYGRSCADVMLHGMTATATPTSTIAPTSTATSLPVYATVLPSGARMEIKRTFSYGDIALTTIVALAFVFYIITWLFRYLWTAGKRTT